jgi:hypothetical protein
VTGSFLYTLLLYIVEVRFHPFYTNILSVKPGTGCSRRYYHEYAVYRLSPTSDDYLRVYYPGVPEFVQVAEHFFIETQVLEFFANGMVFGW